MTVLTDGGIFLLHHPAEKLLSTGCCVSHTVKVEDQVRPRSCVEPFVEKACYTQFSWCYQCLKGLSSSLLFSF